MKITQSECFLKQKKDSQVFFFAKGPVKFKVQLVWKYLTSQETGLKFMFLVRLQKNRENCLFSIKDCDWIIFFQVSWFEQSLCNAGHSSSYKNWEKKPV